MNASTWKFLVLIIVVFLFQSPRVLIAAGAPFIQSPAPAKAQEDVRWHKLTINNDPFAYSSEYNDLESHLQYLNARYYRPNTRRFIQRDSYALMNRYAYADGNPVSNEDPSGHLSGKLNPSRVLNTIAFYVGFVSSALEFMTNLYTRASFIKLLNPDRSSLASLESLTPPSTFLEDVRKKNGTAVIASSAFINILASSSSLIGQYAVSQKNASKRFDQISLYLTVISSAFGVTGSIIRKQGNISHFINLTLAASSTLALFPATNQAGNLTNLIITPLTLLSSFFESWEVSQRLAHPDQNPPARVGAWWLRPSTRRNQVLPGEIEMPPLGD